MEKNSKFFLWSAVGAAIIIAVVIGIMFFNGGSEAEAVEESADAAGNIQLLIFERDLANARARGMVISEDGKTLLSCSNKNIAEAPVPPCVKTIAPGAFANCIKLHKVELPAGIESIGAGAFMNCRSLREVKIPVKVRSIGAGAFADCRNLRKITLSEKVEYIGQWAFANCWDLETVNVSPTQDISLLGKLPPNCTVDNKKE